MNHSLNEQLAAEWTRAQRTVAAYLASTLGDFHEAEEVLARVAMAAVRKYDTYDASRPFAAWAIGIAKLEVLNYRRQVATDKHVFDDALLDQITESYQRQAQALGSHREALAECLKRVDGRARRALELRYTENLKPAAIAEQLMMSGGAVRMLLMRTRASLRDCIRSRLGTQVEHE
jgi:RNA polymerase sigma-70 factor (ECF subfamily)